VDAGSGDVGLQGEAPDLGYSVTDGVAGKHPEGAERRHYIETCLAQKLEEL
jgi:hypothetical protein